MQSIAASPHWWDGYSSTQKENKAESGLNYTSTIKTEMSEVILSQRRPEGISVY